jgi:hypothetical protein
MGQRLVVTIKKGDRKLCNIYYHWSAYTYSALLETKKIINCIYNHKDEAESELLLRLIRFCEENGGGIRGVKDEFAYIQSLYPNEIFVTENYSRSEGLIALSEKGMRDLQSWSEGDVYINLDTDEVDFCVYSGYEDFEEYIQNRKSWDDEFDETELDDIPEFDFCLGYFDVDDIDAIIHSLDRLGNNEFVIVCDNEVCELIA